MITPDSSRIFWLKITIALGLIFGLALSPNLWTDSRFYPLTPVFDILSPISSPFDWFFLLALICSLIAVIIVPRPRPYLWGSLAILVVLMLLDQQRLQPWAYQYAFMLATLGMFSWKSDDVRGEEVALNICRFVVASIYFWSGLQKLNAIFIGDIFLWMVAPIATLLPVWAQPLVYIFGFCVPFIEMSIGIGLLTKKFRRMAIVFALAMCLFVLWTLGPFGYNWNSVVWPWNIAMAALVVILFSRTNISLRNIVWIKNNQFHKLIVVVFGILPFFYFFNIWDSYPSWSLYSGTTNEAVIYMSNGVKERLPLYVQQFIWVDAGGRNVLDISDWAFAELNTPPYPETRIFKSVARSMCKIANDPNEVLLVINGRLSWFYRDRQQTLDCTRMK